MYKGKSTTSFFQKLPNQTVEKCLDQMSDLFNRDYRRGIEKEKTLDSKVDWILHMPNYRTKFIELLCQEYKTDDDFDDSLPYDSIVNSATEQNCIPVLLHLFYRCFSDRMFFNAHFYNLQRSKLMDNFLNDSWEKDEAVKKYLSEAEPKIEEFSNEEETKMITYLGAIELKRTYYNFKPQYIIEGETINHVQNTEELFPIYGSLNLSYPYRYGNDVHTFLKTLSVFDSDVESDNANDKGFFAVSFSHEEIEDNDDSNIKKKFDLQKLLDNGIDLADRIQFINDYNIYKIVTPNSSTTDIKDILNQEMVAISESCTDGCKVLLKIENKLFGPYTANIRQFDGCNYVKPNSVGKKYILDYFVADSDNCKPVLFKYQQYSKNIINFEYVQIINLDNKISYDVIRDELLLSKFSEDVSVDLLSSNPEEFGRLCETSPFLNSYEIPEEFRKSRIERVKEIVRDVNIISDEKNMLIKTLLTNIKPEILNQITDEQISKTDLYQRLSNKSQDLRDENERLLKANDDLKRQLENIQSLSAPLEKVSDEEYEKLKEENERLSQQLGEFVQKENIKVEIKKLKEDKKRLQSINDDLTLQINDKKKAIEKLENDVENVVLKKIEGSELVQKAFDPYISNALVNAAGKVFQENEESHYKLIANYTGKISCETSEREALVDKLVVGVQRFRKYTRNDIINMYICLTQNFLTIFSGEPGIGKTSICDILATSLGLNNFSAIKADNEVTIPNRYVPVSVERGWSTKRDLIGYYNPLTQKYDKSDSKIYNALMILNEERENSRFPYVVLLDEANLSPMEYYWADFMRCADQTNTGTYINIGTVSDIYIPKTLRFLATINNDQTTEELSPRLIDRAWIIKLPSVAISETDELPNNYFSDKKIILWSDLEQTFSSSKNDDVLLKKPLDDIYELFARNNLPVSPRIQQSIKHYICIAQELMENENTADKKQKALDFAVLQRLLPKINGSYNNFKIFFEKLHIICADNHLNMTNSALSKMEEYQSQNMGYCKYIL